MSTTTGFGSWNAVVGGSYLTMQVEAVEALGEFVFTETVLREFLSAWRDSINQAIAPYGVVLCGDEFYSEYPVRADYREVRDAVLSVDFWELVDRFNRGAP